MMAILTGKEAESQEFTQTSPTTGDRTLMKTLSSLM